MKTLNFFKYFLLVVFGATLMFSCSDDESDKDLLNSEKSTIVLRNEDDGGNDGGDFDPDCFVEICATITPNTTDPNFVDIYTVQILGVGTITISNNIVTLLDGTQIPLINNQFCASIPVTGSSTAILSFKGYGGVDVVGTWENGAECELFSALYDGSTKSPLKASEEVVLTCESPCPPLPECFVDVCVNLDIGDPSDIFFINYPTIGQLQITNGIVTLPDGSQQPLVNGQFCATIPLFDPTTVLISFYGYGSAVVTADYGPNQICTVYEAGVDYDGYVHLCENVTLTCEPPCPPTPDCFIEVCATITPGDPSDIYFVTLPNVGIVQIANGIVTLPDGSTMPLVNNQFCTQIPIFDTATANLSFFGTGAVVVTAEWANGAICEIFSAGVGTDEYTHICEEVTLTCESVCPPPPDCFVKVCAEFIQGSVTDIYIVQLPGVGVLTIQNGWVTLPGGAQVPLGPDNTYCASIPIYGSSTAILSYKGVGSVVTTATWEDGTSCQIFSAGVGTSSPVKVSDNVELTCEPDCPVVETCIVEICAQITPNTTNSYPDIYTVTLPNGGGTITIQNGLVTLPDGSVIPLIGNTFCAEIEVPVGGSSTATLSFKGYGAVVTKGIWPDTSCLLFSAGVGTTNGVLKTQDVTIQCDPPC